MDYRNLGRTGLSVSAICLGTMTWGSQNSEEEGHAQIACALDRGVNFIDTAEMYPVTPSRPETRGRTEEIVGSWFAANGGRDKVVLATKVMGPFWMEPIRGGNNRLDRRNVELAVDASLKRLRTDYIDLYQLHWPDRTVPKFGGRGLSALAEDAGATPIEETLDALAGLVRAGKVRHVGVSNETPWGVAQFLKHAETKGLPRIASIQNAYNLLNRLFEGGLSEFALREDVGLLAYSPLAAGHLSGKYMGGVIPKGSRLDVAHQFTRYDTPPQPDATARYVAIAHAFGLDPVQMALAFVNDRPFVTADIIGATSVEQLRTAIDSIDLKLSDEVLAAIETVHRLYPDPCP